MSHPASEITKGVVLVEFSAVGIGKTAAEAKHKIMVIVLRRSMVLLALMIWQGGALFYALVVVPTGRAVFGTILKQAEITRQVTWYLNWLGLSCLAIVLWDVWSHRQRYGRIPLGQGLTWLGLAGSVAILFGLHPWLDALMNHPAAEVSDHDRFLSLHGCYLAASVAQTLFGLGFLIASLQTWRTVDREEDRPQSCSYLPLELYTRPGCHLCEEAEQLLEELNTSYRIALRKVDITSDPQLTAQYGERIPVIVVKGRPRLWGRINRALLERLLQSHRSPKSSVDLQDPDPRFESPVRQESDSPQTPARHRKDPK